MTEFEWATLTQGQASLISNSYYYYSTFLSAFLVASYLAAHRLTTAMATLLVGLFVLNQLYVLSVIAGQLRAIFGMIVEIRRVKDAGAAFSWLGKVDASLDWLLMLPLGIAVVSLLGAVLFFFHCRRVNRMAEPGAAMPKA